VGCSLGNCHHEHGNVRGKARVERTQKILEQVGLEPERLDMFFLSGGMGATFAQIARQMTERIQELGPNPLRNKAAQQQLPSPPKSL
jgi:coenzyme F420-reducing hydrogenase delta subunit